MNRFSFNSRHLAICLGCVFICFTQNGTYRLPDVPRYENVDAFYFIAPVDSLRRDVKKSGSTRYVPAIVIGPMQGF